MVYFYADTFGYLNLRESKKLTKLDSLKYEINMTELFLKDEEENGHKRVHDKIVDLKIKLRDLETELKAEMEREEVSETAVKENSMEINLKQFVDEREITLEKLSEDTGLELELLKEMYNNGTFDGDKLGVNTLTNLMQALDIININELIPTIK